MLSPSLRSSIDSQIVGAPDLSEGDETSAGDRRGRVGSAPRLEVWSAVFAAGLGRSWFFVVDPRGKETGHGAAQVTFPGNAFLDGEQTQQNPAVPDQHENGEEQRFPAPHPDCGDNQIGDQTEDQ